MNEQPPLLAGANGIKSKLSSSDMVAFAISLCNGVDLAAIDLVEH